MKKIILFFLLIGFAYSVFGQEVNVDEIKDYVYRYQYATLKIITKIYAREVTQQCPTPF